jgi:hypothetical protein
MEKISINCLRVPSWVLYVERVLEAPGRIRDDRVITMHFKDFVRHPRDHLRMIAEFAGIDPAFWMQAMDLRNVSQANIDKGLKGTPCEAMRAAAAPSRWLTEHSSI